MPYPAPAFRNGPYLTHNYYAHTSWANAKSNPIDADLFTAEESWATLKPGPDRQTHNFFVKKGKRAGDETERTHNFFVKKAKRPGDEIDVKSLHPELQKLFTKKGGSRDLEWQ